jgi:hypothetical protein
MNRVQAIDAAELELLAARRQLAQSELRPELLPLATNGLRAAARLFLEAGMTHRATTVWRYAYRLRKKHRRSQPSSDVTTLTEVIEEMMFNHGRKEGDA